MLKYRGRGLTHVFGKTRSITFEWKGVQYKVGYEAFDRGLDIKLPDNTRLQVGIWTSGEPPVPRNLREVGDIFVKNCAEAVVDFQYSPE